MDLRETSAAIPCAVMPSQATATEKADYLIEVAERVARKLCNIECRIRMVPNDLCSNEAAYPDIHSKLDRANEILRCAEATSDCILDNLL